jgi:hypothetical protein
MIAWGAGKGQRSPPTSILICSLTWSLTWSLLGHYLVPDLVTAWSLTWSLLAHNLVPVSSRSYREMTGYRILDTLCFYTRSTLSNIDIMSLSDLPTADYQNRIDKFLPQMKEDMCYSACLTNLVNDLSQRDLISLHMTLKKMNEMCDYQWGFGCKDKIIPKIMTDLLKPYGYLWKETMNPSSALENLRDIASNPKFSLPVVNLSGEYFNAVGGTTIGQENWDHTLIVMGVDHDIVYVYDPYETLFSRKGHIENVTRHMSIPAFLKLWDGAKESTWRAWAEPETPRQTKLSV